MKTLSYPSFPRFAALFLGAVLALTGVAQTQPIVGRADRNFLEDSAKAGVEEVQISRIAVERATNPQVRDFAQMLVNEHEQLNSELSTLAGRKGVTLPAHDNDKLSKWTTKKADNFDEDYLEAMIDGHQKSVDRFEKATKRNDDPEVSALASKYLGAIQAHLAKAKELEKLVD